VGLSIVQRIVPASWRTHLGRKRAGERRHLLFHASAGDALSAFRQTALSRFAKTFCERVDQSAGRPTPCPAAMETPHGRLRAVNQIRGRHSLKFARDDTILNDELRHVSDTNACESGNSQRLENYRSSIAACARRCRRAVPLGGGKRIFVHRRRHADRGKVCKLTRMSGRPYRSRSAGLRRGGDSASENFRIAEFRRLKRRRTYAQRDIQTSSMTSTRRLVISTTPGPAVLHQKAAEDRTHGPLHQRKGHDIRMSPWGRTRAIDCVLSGSGSASSAAQWR